MKEIHFTVTIDEANLILEGLGHLPFAKVYQLVGKLQEQARQQVNGDAASTDGHRAAAVSGA
jgi:hypothetical protein